jgi:hypothetical protein
MLASLLWPVETQKDIRSVQYKLYKIFQPIASSNGRISVAGKQVLFWIT